MQPRALLRLALCFLIVGCALDSLEGDLTPTPPREGESEGGSSPGVSGATSAGSAGRLRGSGGRTLSAGRAGTSRGEGGAGGENEPSPLRGGTAGRGNAGSAGRGGTTAASGADGGVSGDAGSSEVVEVAGAAGAGSAAPPVVPDTLFFSEYVEGSSNNKALEISSTSPCALDGCAIEIHLNGAPSASVRVELRGELFPELPLVVCHAKFAELERCDLTGTLSFNGNDRVRLTCAQRLLDSIGSVGAAPELHWGTGELTTSNGTLRRRCDITVGDRDEQDVFDPASEWIAAGADVFDGLGSHCDELQAGSAEL